MVTIAKPSQWVVIDAILEERRFQDQKYGPPDHELGTWLLITEKELNEAKDAATGHGAKERTGRNTARAELVQIAAVAMAALEQHGLTEPTGERL